MSLRKVKINIHFELFWTLYSEGLKNILSLKFLKSIIYLDHMVNHIVSRLIRIFNRDSISKLVVEDFIRVEVSVW